MSTRSELIAAFRGLVEEIVTALDAGLSPVAPEASPADVPAESVAGGDTSAPSQAFSVTAGDPPTVAEVSHDTAPATVAPTETPQSHAEALAADKALAEANAAEPPAQTPTEAPLVESEAPTPDTTTEAPAEATAEPSSFAADLAAEAIHSTDA